MQAERKTSDDLAKKYEAVRAHTENLCAALEPEDYIPQPVPEVSPAKWNIAHTTWFFEEMILKNHAPDYSVFDPHFSFLFNSYYNSVGDRTNRNNRGDLARPTVGKVFEYRRHVDDAMRALLLTKNLPDAARELVILGINHEQQHQELLVTDLKFTFAQNPLFPVYRDNYALEEICELPSENYVAMKAGIYEIGYNGDGDFHFDNETARHKVYLHDFEIRESLVTNREYLAFIAAGGYRDHALWHAEGWDWVNENRINAPLYWHEKDSEQMNFTLSGLRKLNLDAPVCHVSFYEAAAFAEWSGARLATEFEWEAANGKFNWGLRWEWTNSAYLPYPNFKKPAGAVGEYNGKFMINQMVLRGASVATPADHSRPSYRNFFHPQFRWQFTGIRLAR